ncbi:hypothetical protein CGH57_01265 [Vibrio parahaemolyticus]|nr:hypothetical protein CGH57_01265 [Vibrio parahaemolyticus]
MSKGQQSHFHLNRFVLIALFVCLVVLIGAGGEMPKNDKGQTVASGLRERGAGFLVNLIRVDGYG